MEYATVSYLESRSLMSEEEMRGISENPKLLHSLKQSLDDIQEARYRIVG